LIPAAIDDRVAMFGYANELAGENGFGWSKRLAMIHRGVTAATRRRGLAGSCSGANMATAPRRPWPRRPAWPRF
jgi:hypothetical protein